MNVELILQWNQGQPELQGMYYAAVKYGEAAGIFEFVTWDGNQWNLDNPGEVIAFIDLGSLKNQLNVQWPNTPPQPISGDLNQWEEV